MPRVSIILCLPLITLGYKAFNPVLNPGLSAKSQEHKRINHGLHTTSEEAFLSGLFDTMQQRVSTILPCKVGLQYTSEFDILSGKTESVQACQRLCKGSFGCFYWSYDTINTECFLKSANAAKVSAQPREDFISGSRTCTLVSLEELEQEEKHQHSLAPTSCIRNGVMYQGADISFSEVGVANAELCQRICQATLGCAFFSYITPSNVNVALRRTCHLKGHATAGSGKRKLHVKSGPASCAEDNAHMAQEKAHAHPSPLPTMSQDTRLLFPLGVKITK